MLFATLDPTLRAVDLPHGARVILSDTVGFISDLPTMLVAAFRATLEEVIEADVILHVRDVSHDDAEAQMHDVETVLQQLGIDLQNDPEHRHTMIEVWNKIDRLDAHERARLANIAERKPPEQRPVLVSAITGQGIDALCAAIEDRLSVGRVVIELQLDPADGAGVSWLHRHTEVLRQAMDENGRFAMTVRAAQTRRTPFARNSAYTDHMAVEWLAPIRLCVTLSALLCACASPHAQTATLRFWRNSFFGARMTSLNLFVAEHQGFFTRENVALDIVPIAGGTGNMVAALDRGDVDVTQTATPYLIQAVMTARKPSPSPARSAIRSIA